MRTSMKNPCLAGIVPRKAKRGYEHYNWEEADYSQLLNDMQTETQRLYAQLWPRRKESRECCIMAKQMCRVYRMLEDEASQDEAFTFLGDHMPNWREDDTLFYKGLVSTMNSRMQYMLDFFRYGRVHGEHTHDIEAIEGALEQLDAAQQFRGTAQEAEAWRAFFDSVRREYKNWWD